MPHKPLLIIMQLVVLLLSAIQVQAQDRLTQPQNIRVENDTVVWDTVAKASGYRVQWLRVSGRTRIVIEEVTRNRFSLSQFHYGEEIWVKIQAISADSGQYHDSPGLYLN